LKDKKKFLTLIAITVVVLAVLSAFAYRNRNIRIHLKYGFSAKVVDIVDFEEYKIKFYVISAGDKVYLEAMTDNKHQMYNENGAGYSFENRAFHSAVHYYVNGYAKLTYLSMVVERLDMASGLKDFEVDGYKFNVKEVSAGDYVYRITWTVDEKSDGFSSQWMEAQIWDHAGESGSH